DGGDRRPSGPRGDSDFNRGPKPYGDRPPRQGGDRPAYGGPRDGGDRRPSGPRGEGGFSRGPKPFGDRAPRQGGDRPAYAGPRDGGDRRPSGPKPFGGEGNAYRGPKAGNGGPAASRPGSYLPVLRAKKMPQRHLSGKLEQKMLKLRETRIDPNKGLHEMRLQKALALMGLGSRRDMDEMITQGRVSVNGEVAEPGTRVVPGDKVRVDGRQLAIRWPDRLPRVIVYHKQEGEIVTRDDPEGRVTVFERLPQTRSSKWVAVGRLDVNTSGLLIFTTSGELANRMTHPSFEVDREYAVRTLGALTPDQMKESTRDIELEDGPARFQFIREEDDKEESANHWYRVGLREGRNREVRRLFEHFGLTVSRLIRVRFGIVTLPSRLKRGQFYELNELEVAKLVQWAGLTLAGTSDDV
ncbi:pseudouridine synthase, partial [Microvirgula aerodenitrificans]